MRENRGKKRLLCIVGSMNQGGAETFLMKLYRELDRTNYQMDFYCMSLEEGYYEKEIAKLGGRVFHSVPKSNNIIKSFITLKNIIKDNKYDHVMRISQHSLATLDLVAARLGGAKTLIQRSSNTNTTSKISRVLHTIFLPLPRIIPNIKIAPCIEAAEYTFGKGCIKKGKAIIIKNAIKIEQYLFDQKKRNDVRKELGIVDKFVVGHVGRFSTQKNHSFLIEIFNEIVKKHKNSVLILVGKGELEKDIMKKIESLDLKTKVIFTGVRSDVPDLMMAMDVFIFPSFFEGMPNTVIEAQATGLPCIITDTITKEVKITDIVNFMSLNHTTIQWADAALEYKDRYERKNMKNCFVKNGYHIDSVTRTIENLIFDR